MNQKQYLQKLKWRLSFKLPAATQRKVLRDVEILLQEQDSGNEEAPEKKFGTYKEFASGIAWKKNYRWLFLLVSVLGFIISSCCFIMRYDSGNNFEYRINFPPIFVIVFFAVSLWFLFGINCFWENCYQYNKKKFAVEQSCIFVLAMILQAVLLWVIPDMLLNMQFILVSTEVQHGLRTLILLSLVVLIIQMIRGRWQAYFSLIQVMGILCSMVAYNFILLHLEELEYFSENAFIMTPYFASVLIDIVFYCMLKGEIDMDGQVQYLQKLKWRLSFKLPAATQRKVLRDVEILLQEQDSGNEEAPEEKFGTSKEFSNSIPWKRNYRWLFLLISLLGVVVSVFWFLTRYDLGAELNFSSIFMVVFFAASLWFLFGIDCFWEDCYQHNKKKFAMEQLCFFIFAMVLQSLILWVIPDMLVNMQFILISDEVRYSLFYLLLMFMVVLTIQMAGGRWQAYFSLIQVMGILCSMVEYNLTLSNTVELDYFVKNPFIMMPYFVSVFVDIVSYYMLKRVMDSQVREEKVN